MAGIDDVSLDAWSNNDSLPAYPLSAGLEKKSEAESALWDCMDVSAVSCWRVDDMTAKDGGYLVYQQHRYQQR